jgi:hypothetical protein
MAVAVERDASALALRLRDVHRETPPSRRNIVMPFHHCNGMEGDVVKLKIAATLTGTAIGASLVLGCFLLTSPVASAAQPACSVEKLQGRYVFTGQGSNLHYGAFDFDGAGKFLGKQTSLRHAVAQRENLRGTYTVDTDCTGTMALEGQPGGTAHWDVFLTSDGKKGRMIRTDSGVAGVRTFEQ